MTSFHEMLMRSPQGPDRKKKLSLAFKSQNKRGARVYPIEDGGEWEVPTR